MIVIFFFFFFSIKSRILKLKGFDLSSYAATIMKTPCLILATGYPLLCLLSFQFGETLFLSVKYTRNAANWLKLATLHVLMHAPRAPAFKSNNTHTAAGGASHSQTHPRDTFPLLWDGMFLLPSLRRCYRSSSSSSGAASTHVISLLSFVLF